MATASKKKKTRGHTIACIASVSEWVRRESWGDNKQEEWRGKGGGRRKRCFLFSTPHPLPLAFFFRSRSNFRPIARGNVYSGKSAKGTSQTPTTWWQMVKNVNSLKVACLELSILRTSRESCGGFCPSTSVIFPNLC